MTTLRGTLRLTRASLALSPIADGLAGAAIAAAAGFAKNGVELAASLVASLSCFLFGMIQNDFCDRDVDRARGGRPIVTGEVSISAARNMATFAAVVALSAAALASPRALLLTVALLAAITAYNVSPSHLGYLGPFVLGAIRGTNLLLGASTAPIAAIAAAAVYAGFIAAIAFVGRMEDGAIRPSAPRVVGCVAISILFATLAPAAAARGIGTNLEGTALLGSIAIVSWLAFHLRSLLRQPIASGPRLARFVGVALSSIFFFDAGLAFQAGAPHVGIVILLMFAVSRVLVRSFPPS